MCCFSQPVQSVAGTRIFARALDGGTQMLAYQMSFAAVGDLAMILPLPVPRASAEDAVRFIDLSGYEAFFTDVERAFPAPIPGGFGAGPIPSQRVQSSHLVVHSVGDFHASFVPSQSDFARLDARFRIDPAVWARLPRYADWGFAVFKLKGTPAPSLLSRVLGRVPSTEVRDVHPMAFEFPRRDPTTIFFPTVHVHDGEVHEQARFDHTLYCQVDDLVAGRAVRWTTSPEPLGVHVDAARAMGLVHPERRAFRSQIIGMSANQDIEVPLATSTAA